MLNILPHHTSPSIDVNVVLPAFLRFAIRFRVADSMMKMPDVPKL
jgi:hypothetical protein